MAIPWVLNRYLVVYQFEIQAKGDQFRFLIEKDLRIERTEKLFDCCRPEAPDAWDRGDDASQIGIANVVLVHVHIVMIAEFQHGSDLAKAFVIIRRYENLQFQRIVEMFVEEWKFLEPVIWTHKGCGKVIETSPRSQACGRSAALKEKIGLPNHVLPSPEEGVVVVQRRPLILTEKKIIW